MKAMALKVNLCLNRSGLNRNDQCFIRKMRTAIVDRMEVGELTISFSFIIFILLYTILCTHFLFVL